MRNGKSGTKLFILFPVGTGKGVFVFGQIYMHKNMIFCGFFYKIFIVFIPGDEVEMIPGRSIGYGEKKKQELLFL